MKTKLHSFFLALALLAGVHQAAAQGTAFTYQGQLQNNGSPASGTYDLTFAVFTDSNGVNQIGGTLTNTATGITNGLFTVVLDFGPGIFTGPPLWLQIGVETNGGGGSFTALAPLQQLTPTPYAIYSESAGSAASANVASSATAAGFATTAGTANGVAAGSVTGAGIAGSSVVKSLNNLQDAVTLSPGANVTITPSGNTLTIASSGGGGGSNWSLTGNSGTTPGLNFLGTTDNQPLELHVSGARALRLEPGSGQPNVIGGAANNVVTGGTVGATIGGGVQNSVSANNGTVGGGIGNSATGTSSFVGGGGSDGTYYFGNTASGTAATIGGGIGNQATGPGSFVGGGGYNTTDLPNGNTASGIGSTVVGGIQNLANNLYSTVCGGGDNQAIGGISFVGGGDVNISSGYGSTIGGGAVNTNSGLYATIGGGFGNSATGTGSFIGGGGYDGTSYIGNTASGKASTVAGGLGNKAEFYYATVGGGNGNISAAQASTVAGGTGNVADALYATVGGGSGNICSVEEGTIGGGYGNIINNFAQDATIGGGSGNLNGGYGATIGGGYNNTNNGTYATIPGGYGNVARGNASFAAGQSVSANDNNSFIWGDGSRAGVSQGVNSFSVLATGGAWFFSGAYPAGVKLLANGTQWISISDRNAKKNMVPVDCQAVLEKLAAIPIQQWNYKWEKDSDVPNIGPMAQDFKHAFYPGRDDKGIGTLEFDGVELAAIQGLNQKLEQQRKDKDAEIQTLKQQNDSLADRLNELESAVKQLTTQKKEGAQ
jgi:hypothetical protein